MFPEEISSFKVNGKGWAPWLVQSGGVYHFSCADKTCQVLANERMADGDRKPTQICHRVSFLFQEICCPQYLSVLPIQAMHASLHV